MDYSMVWFSGQAIRQQGSNSHFGGRHEAEDLVLKEQSAPRWLLSPVGLCSLSAAALAPRGSRHIENCWQQGAFRLWVISLPGGSLT
jgi:hypothetical protein